MEIAPANSCRFFGGYLAVAIGGDATGPAETVLPGRRPL